MGKRTVQISVGAVSSGKNPEWLVTAVLARAQEGYTLITVCKKKPKLVGFRIEIKLQMSEKDIKLLPGELLIADGKRLNVLAKGYLPFCHKCETRGHTREICPKLTEDTIEKRENEVVQLRVTVEVNKEKSVVDNVVVTEAAATDVTAEDESKEGHLTKSEAEKTKKGNIIGESNGVYVTIKNTEKTEKNVEKKGSGKRILYAVSVLKKSYTEGEFFTRKDVTKLEPDPIRPRRWFVLLSKETHEEYYEMFPTEIST